MGATSGPLSALKRALGRLYRDVKRSLEHFVFEPGLRDTWVSDASSGHTYLARGLRGYTIKRSDTLLDYGSGKGRMLLAAGRYPFGRVLGIELDAEYCEIARTNAQLAAPRLRCPRIEVVSADATTWPVPDDVTYIYMYNPFWGETFRAMLDRVSESLDRRPRELTIIYANGKCTDELLATGRFRHVRTSRGIRPVLRHHRIDVFRSIAPPSAPLSSERSDDTQRTGA
jgi:predicted RNA methylase